MRIPFLTAQWRDLVMLNYEIDPEVLLPRLPRGTQLDLWQDKALVSIVGFRFLHTRIAGFAVPQHRHFEEVNLRFYVKRFCDGEWRRGVVFVREIVPRRAIAIVARVFYNEPYLALPMRHDVKTEDESRLVRYQWFEKRWHTLQATTSGPSRALVAESEEEFIAQHFWGYTAQRDGGCLEYHVAHPRWRIWTAQTHRFDCDVERFYGKEFCAALHASPRSAFVAQGSAVAVFQGVRL